MNYPFQQCTILVIMENSISRIAALIGEPVRARILWSLLDGRAYTARELAIGVDTSPQNLSMHLAKLLQAGLLSVEVQGRHRYYTFAREEVAYAIEAMANLVPAQSVERQDADEVPIKFCRTCYDHLAGKVGVLIMESLLRQKLIIYQQREGMRELEVTPKGVAWMREWGIDCEAVRQQRRSFVKPCLDWSERRHHLAGGLGAAMLNKMMESHWLRRTAHSRAVVVTAKGQQALTTHFNIQI
jgi:DNA-binding transcriptional ArsR family regulator